MSENSVSPIQPAGTKILRNCWRLGMSMWKRTGYQKKSAMMNYSSKCDVDAAIVLILTEYICSFPVPRTCSLAIISIDVFSQECVR